LAKTKKKKVYVVETSPGKLETFDSWPACEERVHGKPYAFAGGATREEAIRTMQRALGEFVIEGPASTIPILKAVLQHSDFRQGEHDTGFMERYYGNAAALAGLK